MHPPANSCLLHKATSYSRSHHPTLGSDAHHSSLPRTVASWSSAVTQITSVSSRIVPSRSLAVTYKISSASTPFIVTSLAVTNTRHKPALRIWMAGWPVKLCNPCHCIIPGRSKIHTHSRECPRALRDLEIAYLS